MPKDNTSDTSLGLRDVSAARCAVALRDHGNATVAEVARLTGLSRPTVEAGIASMISRGLVTDTDAHTIGGRGVGRPARLFEFKASAGYVIAVDVGIHRIRVAVANLTGDVLSWVEERIGAPLNGAARMTLVKSLIRRALDDAASMPAKVVAMTVAVSGMVDTDGRLLASVLLPDWEGVDVAGYLRAEFGCAVIVENDMRLAALAEHRLGTAQLMDDVIFFFLGHRVAMGLVIDGELRRGHHSAAGEIGDMAFGDLLDSSGELVWITAASGEEVFRRAAEGHANSKAEVDAFVEGLATGIAVVTMAIDPDIVVIGGGLSRAGNVLLDPLRRSVSSRIKVPVRPSIKASELGTESVVLGALALASSEASALTFGVRGLPDPVIDVARARRAAEIGAAA